MTTDQPTLCFRQTYDGRIDLHAADGSPVASYRFDPQLPKPCFHPLFTAAGRQIAGFQMSDHPWHRGLWFAIKFINKTNFWEENPPLGIQQTVAQPQCQFASPRAVRIAHALRWTSQATGPVIDETRQMIFTAESDGTRIIDFSSSLMPLQDLELDRTPYTTWGGYGGLTFRASREVHGTGFLLPDGQTANAIIGQSHPWVLLRGLVDGEPEARVSIGMIDYPANPRSPSPWYGKAGQSYDFFNAAFLFHEPMTVQRGRVLNFRYRFVYGDGWWEAPQLAALAQAFVESPP